jgi:hypothetical protein
MACSHPAIDIVAKGDGKTCDLQLASQTIGFMRREMSRLGKVMKFKLQQVIVHFRKYKTRV